MTFHLLNPGGRGRYVVKVEHPRVDNLVQFHVAVVGVDDSRFGLQSAHNLTDTSHLVGTHFSGFVQQYDVAELNLLDDQVLNVLLVNVGTCQVQSAAELILHAQGIDHGDDAVQSWLALHVRSHCGNAADGLCYGTGLADTAGFNDDVVEALHLDDVLQLLHEVHLQRTADATVLQGYQTVVLLVDDASGLYQVGIDVHLANVVDNNGKLDAALVT